MACAKGAPTLVEPDPVAGKDARSANRVAALDLHRAIGRPEHFCCDPRLDGARHCAADGRAVWRYSCADTRPWQEHPCVLPDRFAARRTAIIGRGGHHGAYARRYGVTDRDRFMADCARMARSLAPSS